jgi:hypothetical protein
MKSSSADREMATLLQRAFSKDGVQKQQELLREVVEFLLTEGGKELLRAQLEFQPFGQTITVDSWSKHVVGLQQEKQLGKDLAEKLRPILETLFPEMFEPSGDTKDAAATVAQYLAALGALKQGRNVFAQILEGADDAFGHSRFAGVEGAIAPGLIAAGVAFIISGGMQTSMYYAGKVRWDDGLDKVAGDSIKAGITGIIVSAAVAAMTAPGAGLSAPAALAVAVPLSIAVYAAVSATCDAIYDKLLGGAEILEARRVYVDYLDVARYIREQYYPKLEAMPRLGSLVEVLGDIQRGEGNREQLLNRASRTLAQMTTRYQLELPEVDKVAGEALFHDLLKRGGVKKEFSRRTVYDLAAEIHREYWSIHNGTDKAKVPKNPLIGRLTKKRGLVGQEQKDFESLAGFLFALEDERPSADEPICFKLTHTGPRRPSCLLASDAEELESFLSLLGGRDWKGLPKPANLQLTRVQPGKNAVHETGSLVKQLVKHAKSQRNEQPPFDVTDLERVYDAWLVPLGGEVVNPLYRKGLFHQLLSGTQHLFKVNPVPGKKPAAYLCIPRSNYSGGEPDQEDGHRLRESLQSYHPWMLQNPDVLGTLEEVDLGTIKKVPDGLFVLMGYRLLPLELYTGTYRVQSPRSLVVSYVYKEAYFNSIAEAWVGFGAPKFGPLVGVRPGGILMTRGIVQQLQEAADLDPWAIQNALFARMCAGMILLDRSANRRAAILQNFAGSGVVASWYWSLTGHTRGELLAALRDETTEQALRLELMDTLLAAYKVHLRSSDFFAESYDQAIAVRGQERRELSEQGAVDEID